MRAVANKPRPLPGISRSSYSGDAFGMNGSVVGLKNAAFGFRECVELEDEPVPEPSLLFVLGDVERERVLDSGE